MITARPEVMLNIQPETVTVITSRREGVSGDKFLNTVLLQPLEKRPEKIRRVALSSRQYGTVVYDVDV